MIMLLLALACHREPTEVICVYPDLEDQDTEAPVETGETGEVVETPLAVTWEGVSLLTCGAVYERSGLLLDADTFAQVDSYSVLLQTLDRTDPAGAGAYEVRDGALYWAAICDEDDTVITLIGVP